MNIRYFMIAISLPLKLLPRKEVPTRKLLMWKNHIQRLEKFIRNNGNRNVGKQELYKIIGASRPSLNKWIDDELISKGKTKEVYAGNQSFDLKKVSEELKI